MPQEPTQYTPSENVLLDSLRHSKLQDNQRQELWNAYHHGTDEKEFVDNINKFDYKDDVKQSLYNLRFKGSYQGPSDGGGAMLQALVPSPPIGQPIPRDTQIKPHTPTLWERAGSVVAPFMEHVKMGGAAQDPRLLAPEAAMTPLEQERHPIATATGEFAGGLTTGGNIAAIAATGGLGTIPGMAGKIIPRLVSAGFSATMLKGAYEQYKPFREALDRGDANAALYHFTHGVLGGAFAAQAGQHAVRGKISPTVKPQVRGETPIEAIKPKISTPKGPEPQLTRESMPQPAPINPQEIADLQKEMPGRVITAENVPEILRERITQKSVENLIAPKPQEVPISDEVPSRIKDAGLVDKGELIKGSGIYQVEHPDHPGLTATVKGSDSVKDIKSKLADKLDAFAEKPTVVPGQPLQDPLKLSESAGKLRGAAPRAPDPAIEIAKQLREERQQVQLRQMREQAAPKTEPEIAVQPSHELPAQLQFRLNSLPDLERQVIEAGSEGQREKAQNRLVSTQTEIQKMTLDHVSKLNPEQLGQLKTQMETQGKIGLQQAEAIRNRIEQDTANREVVAPLRRELLPGGPVRKATDPITGERIAVREEQILRRGARDLLHIAMGEKPNTTPEDLIPYEKKAGESQEEHDAYLLRAQTKRVELRKEILNSIEIARDTGNSDDMGVVMDKLHDYDELEGLIGEYPEGSAVKGRRPKIDTTASLSTISLEESRRIMGRQVNKIPSHKEFLSRAQEFETRAGMSNRIANAVKKLVEVRAAKKRGEAGFVGEGKPSTYVTSPTAPSEVKEPIVVPPIKELLAKAEKADFAVWKITAETPSGYKGWISPDGKHFIDSGPLDHADVAGRLLNNADMWASQDRMLEEGWVRKSGTHDFETYKLTPTAIDAIETSLIHDGNYGKEATIDYKEPHGLKTLHIDHGWEDLATDVRRAVREQGIGERGIGAVEPLTGAAIGGISGAAIGHAIGGMPGALLGGGIGWATGFATPAILRSPVFKQAYARMSPILADLKIPPMEWLRGKAQKPIVNPRMEDIIGAQHSDMQGPETSWQTRMALIPGDVLEKVHDRLLFVNDKPGALVRWAMRYDPRGAEFRGLQGRLTSEQSPYVAMRLAANRMAGMQVLNRIDYQNIFSEAHKSGLSNNLDEYLNLKAYSRAYQVLGERMQEHDATIKSAMSELENPEIDPRKKIVMEDAIAEARKEQKSILKRALKGEVVPAGYTVDSIRNDMRTMQENMEPQDFAKVEELAGKVFDINRQHLDMAHNSGIVSDADYQTYVARGNEYIPLHRIMSDMAASEYKTSGRSPMYLRQQNIIHALSGSERINRSPILASADANGSIVRESIRNQTVKKFLSLAEPDPKGVGKLFVEVGSNYKAKAGEALVGAYIDGKPVTYAVPDWMQSTLKHANPVSIDLAGNALLRFTKRLLQDTATGGNLAWSAGNAVRHFGDMALMSEAGLKSLKDFPKDVKDIPIQWIQSLKESVMKDPAWREYVRSGAAFSVFQRNITPEFFLNPQALGYTGKISRSLVLDSVKSFNAMVEDSTKLTTYKRMREAGYGETAAAYETSRYGGGPDFSRMGSATPALNLAFMFFNAHLQYVSRIAERVGEHPARMAAVLAGLTAMTMTLAQWNYQQKDSKGEDLLRKVPINDRENYTVILTGDTYTSHTGAEVPTYYKIAKPSLLKILVNPIENFVNKIVGRETRSGEQLGLDAINSIVPGQAQLREESLAKSAAQTVAASMNPLFRVPLEEGMNWQMVGGGRPIVPQRETGLAPEYQVSPSTPNVYRQMAYGGSRGALAGGAIGGTLGLLIGGPKGFFLAGAAGSAIGSMGISPRRIEHMASGFTAGVGQTAAGLTDIIARPPPLNKPFPFQGQEATRQIPGVGTLASRFIGSPVDQTERNAENKFYTTVQNAQIQVQTLDMLMKQKPGEAVGYVQAHKAEIITGKLGQSMLNRLGQVNSLQRTIQDSMRWNKTPK
jgi:hypothetical protein